MKTNIAELMMGFDHREYVPIERGQVDQERPFEVFLLLEKLLLPPDKEFLVVEDYDEFHLRVVGRSTRGSGDEFVSELGS